MEIDKDVYEELMATGRFEIMDKDVDEVGETWSNRFWFNLSRKSMSFHFIQCKYPDNVSASDAGWAQFGTSHPIYCPLYEVL